ncbi:ATP-dependent helicase HrpB [Celerinatantimonas yamalensis]|uniref:ATP-dependent helicase HrpB n=1 Tax=Celerinatantimonas yamalensis TaxID=559956 RepID=A0ABW9GBS9_9GAMM
MNNLPVMTLINPLLEALSNQQHVLLAAPPGAGKSTAVPLAILRQANLPGLIVMLEPRRLAARHIAGFLAQQLGETLGQQVGYQMRGEAKRSSVTKLLIVTEGVLTRMLQDDPMLEQVSLVIFDEFHERSLPADLGLALCQEACEVNESLALLVMSATLDISALQQTLPHAQVLSCEGRSFAVEIEYSPLREPRYLVEECAARIAALLTQETGNILVFLPGVAEIHRVSAALARFDIQSDVTIHPLYGQMSIQAQRQAIVPPPQGQRKVVLATNIAETSLTIEGIRVVVDSGLERVAQYDGASGVTRLMTKMICQSSAEQRAGRAGRVQAGRCVRLYSSELLNHRPRFNDPQILRSDLSGLLLQLKHWGSPVADLNWVDEPAPAAIERASSLLQQLNLLDENDALTPMGKMTGQWGCEPRCGALLAKALEMGQAGMIQAPERGAYLAALLEQRLPSVASARWNDALQQLDSHGRRQVRQQALRYAQWMGVDTLISDDEHPLDGELLAAALPDRIAKRRAQGQRYLLANGFAVQTDTVTDELLVAIEVGWQEGRANGRLFLYAPIDETQLRACYPDWFVWHSVCEFDADRQGFMSERQQRLGALIFARQPLNNRASAALAAAWLREIQKRGLSWLPMSDNAQAFRDRVLCLQTWCPELSLPDVTDEALLANVELWLMGYLGNLTQFKALKSLDWLAMLKGLFDWQQLNLIDTLAPTHYRAPSGRTVAIHYQVGQMPRLSLKLQEMFGQPQSPTVARDVPVTLELLSPAGRVLQLTQDLASFWQNSYAQVRKEMRGRYPKHPWPEDPIASIATHKTKRQVRRDESL